MRSPASYGTVETASRAPQYRDSAWKRALLAFVEPAMRAGASRQLQSDDLWPAPASAASFPAFQRFQERLKLENGEIPRALLVCHAFGLATCGLMAALCAACDVAAPAVLRFVVDALASPQELNIQDLVAWTALFCLARVAAAFIRAHLRLALEEIGVQATAALRMLLFHKALRRHMTVGHGDHEAHNSGRGVKEATPKASDLANLYSSDVAKVVAAVKAANSLWILPIEITVVVVMLHSLLGAAAFAGLAAIVTAIYVTTLIGRAAGSCMRAVLQCKDRRMEVIREVFGAMLAVKIGAMEEAFERRIELLRNEELGAIKSFIRYRVLSSFVLWASPLLVSTASLAVYTLVMQQTPTAAAIFAALALFSILRDPLRELPNIVQTFIQAKISVERINTFLQLPEYETSNLHREEAVSTVDAEKSAAIRVKNASFGYSKSGDQPVLQHVNLDIYKGDLVVIHGPVGAGKTTLCWALLGETCGYGGNVTIGAQQSEAIAYFSQQPWLQHMTVRDNILFGRPFNSERYSRVLDACALLPDLAAMPSSDLTEIGAKGVNLSGGQRARLALARACYASDAQIVVLDAPLAAVDVAVQREIFSKCIAGGLLADKTVVLATHNLEIIHSELVDCLVEVGDRRVKSSRNLQKPRKRPSSSNKLYTSALQSFAYNTESKSTQEESGRLVADETREAGRVSKDVFRSYLRVFGGFWTISVVLVVLLLWQVCQVSSDLWLSHWTSEMVVTGDAERSRSQWYMLVYSMLTTSCAALVFVRSSYVAHSGLEASTVMFERMTRSLLGARMQFYDANPIGRVLNRYGQDVTTLDFVLPFTLGGFLVNVFMAAAQLLTATSIIWSIAPLVLPLVWVYSRVARFYLASSREIGRLWKVAASPVLSHVAQCEAGAEIIRAFGKTSTDAVVNEHAAYNDHSNRVWLADVAVRQWFQLRIELIGCGFVIFVGGGVIYLRHMLSPGLAGLAFMYALNVDVGLSALVKVWSQVEVQMVSPERVMEYIEIPQEVNAIAPPVPVASGIQMTKACTVSFRDVVFAYKVGGTPALKGVTFSIHAGEHIGVVGRTGAGKSSLVMALLRINELAGGEISIDGANVASIPLHALRSQISVIAQSPVLFRGSIRQYLDPEDSFDDSEIWAALDKVGMKPRVATWPQRLEHLVSAEGDNLSAGERQLLCLARAVLAGNRLVVLDEATAAVDHATEQQLQLTIKREFGSGRATVLTIAHRLATVQHSDRVLVLENGHVVEFGAPQALMADPTSAFAAMCQ